MLKSKFVRVTALVLCAASLVACGAKQEAASSKPTQLQSISEDQLPKDGVVSSDGLVTKNYEAATLPDDSYFGSDPRLVSLAIDISTNLCLLKQGLPAPPVRNYDWNSPSAQKVKVWNRPLLPQEAAVQGYHEISRDPADQAEQAASAQVESFINAQSAQWREKFSACQTDSHKQAPLNQIVEQKYFTTTDFSTHPLLRQAMKQWRACMAPLGIPDLPEDRPGRANSVLEELGLGGADNLNAMDPSTIIDREIQIAVKDAECNEKSRFSRTEYALIWLESDVYARDHAEELAARKRAVEQSDEALKAYIEQHRSEVTLI